MPDPVIHLVVPVLLCMVAADYIGWNKKTVLLLSPIAVLPDLDVLVDLHHGLGHNVFLFTPFIALYAIGHWANNTHLREISIVAAVYLSSHLVFDFFQSGLIPLYPLNNTWVTITASLHLNGLKPILRLVTETKNVPNGGTSWSGPLPLLSPNSLGVLLFTTPLLIYIILKEIRGN